MKRKISTIICLALLISFSVPTKNSWELGTFEKPAENPILKADSTFTFMCPIQKTLVKWQKADVFNPAAIVKDGKVYVLFRAEDNPAAGIGGRTSRIGLAVSNDGVHFTKLNEPVLYPDSSRFMQYDFPGGCEDPRIVESEDGIYVIAYTSWNKQVARLSIATSKDLIHWEKQGPAFAKASSGKFLDIWSKSGSIVTTLKDKKIIAAKINGKYWMYWGEGFVNAAYSDDLINWTPTLDANGGLARAISPRKKMFDSKLTEPGPPALLTEKGILLLYNGKNDEGDQADPALPDNTYSGGQVLFDKNDPAKVIARTTTCFIKPDLPHEVSGQYKAGTTFIEGLVFFQGKWFLYYGTADSMVGLAVSN
jgi:beta-1,2-mannosidase